MNVALIVFSAVVFAVVLGIAIFAVLDIKGVSFSRKGKKKEGGKKKNSAKPAQKQQAQGQKEQKQSAQKKAEELPASKEPEKAKPAEEPAKSQQADEPAVSDEKEQSGIVQAAPAEDKLAQTVPAPAEEVPAQTQNAEQADAEPLPPATADDDETEIRRVEEDGKTRYIVIKYSKSFLAKLIQSDDEVKATYSKIKNELLSYKGVKSRLSWRWETFRAGRAIVARLRIRGKSLSLALPLNPADYEDSKYIVEDFSAVKSFADTPCIYRIKNERRSNYSADLIARVAEEKGLERQEVAQTDYAALYPYESTQKLLEKKLIRELTDEEASAGVSFAPRKSVTVAEADTLIGDEEAQTLVIAATESEDRAYKGKGGKTEIINIDTLSKYFADGETVTLGEIKKRIKEIGPRTSAIKVLARGTLDKKLIVYADAFSLQAVKMIVVTGGKAIRL